jgi:hypothetical protein
MPSHQPGEKWRLEMEGIHVLAVYAPDGFHLSLMDKSGVVKKHTEAIHDLNAALPVARALIEEQLRDERDAPVDWKELFQTVWTRVM